MQRRPAGFTLLEVLVVVAIGATLTALVMLRVGQWRPADDVAGQLERVAGLVQAQCEQAMFQSRPRGVRIHPDGYDFWQLLADGWAPMTGERLDRNREWAGAVRPELLIEGHRVDLDQPAAAPQIVCQPLGELTGFELRLIGPGERRALVGTPSGRIEMARAR